MKTLLFLLLSTVALSAPYTCVPWTMDDPNSTVSEGYIYYTGDVYISSYNGQANGPRMFAFTDIELCYNTIKLGDGQKKSLFQPQSLCASTDGLIAPWSDYQRPDGLNVLNTSIWNGRSFFIFVREYKPDPIQLQLKINGKWRQWVWVGMWIEINLPEIGE